MTNVNEKDKQKEYNILTEDKVSIKIDENISLTVKFNYEKDKLKVYLSDEDNTIATGLTSKELIDTVDIIKDLKTKNKYANISINEDIIAEKLLLLSNSQDEIKKEHKSLKKKNAKESPSYEVNKEDVVIKERLKPKYNNQIAQHIGERIIEEGIVKYLENIYDNLIRGSKKPFIKTFLGAICIPFGISSSFISLKSGAEAGKSHITDIAIKKSIPPEYWHIINKSTQAAFLRKGQTNKNIFERQLFIFGDLGSERQMEIMLFIFDIFKVLITEKYFKNEIMDDGNILELELEANSIGAIYETVDSSIISDEQILSRSIEITPDLTASKDEVIDFSVLSENKLSKTSKRYELALKKLTDFHEFIKFIINQDKVVIIPYINIFKRLSVNSNGDPSKRRTQNDINMFTAFCLLEYPRCHNIKNKYYIPTRSQLEEYIESVAEFTGISLLEQQLIHDLVKRVEPVNDDKVYDLIKKDKYNDYDGYAGHLVSYYGLHNVSDKYNIEIPTDDFTILTGHSRYFFTISLVRRFMSNIKSVKNMPALQDTLYNLYIKGYLHKLDSKYNSNNVYYINPDAFNFIKDPVKVEDEDISNAVQLLHDEYDIDISYEDLSR